MTGLTGYLKTPADFILEYGLWLKDIIFEEISFTFDGLREVACQISTPCRQKYNL